MKKALVLIAACLMLVPAVAQKSSKKGAKEVSPFVEGRQKVRCTDYDTIFKFTTFNQKTVYYLNYDYSKFPALLAKRGMLESKKIDWENFEPVMNYLTTVSRSPMRICALWAVNPAVQDDGHKARIAAQAKEEALESLQALSAWMKGKEMRNKVQVEVAQVDYRYWQGTDYFVKEQKEEPLVHVGLLLYFGTKKMPLFQSAGEGAREWADVKFFPNDATVQPSWESYLDELAAYLQENERYEVLLRGYTDNQGTDAYCIGLARQRCTEIKKKLVARGIADYRVEIEALGTADPIGDNSTLEGRVANNRVAVSIQ